jgi:prophage maintenance system killer protein
LALVDGNKGIACLATVVFVDISGFDVPLSNDAAFALVLDAAQADLDLEEMASRLRVRPRA